MSALLSGLPIPTMDWAATDAPRAFAKFKEMCMLLFGGPLVERRKASQLFAPVGRSRRM